MLIKASARYLHVIMLPERTLPIGVSDELNDTDKVLSASLMRVNHTGEVCAQALYQGQGLSSKTERVKDKMQQAADEEIDHLAWCRQRIDELGGHTSYLDPLWYSGSLGMGILAGFAGDRWSLGFLAETERQVVDHLTSHLERLPPDDTRSRAIIEKNDRRRSKSRDDGFGSRS